MAYLALDSTFFKFITETSSKCLLISTPLSVSKLAFGVTITSPTLGFALRMLVLSIFFRSNSNLDTEVENSQSAEIKWSVCPGFCVKFLFTSFICNLELGDL